MRPWRCVARIVTSLVSIIGVAIASGVPALSAEKGFPYEQELLLDARPMSGSKRIPMMEVMRRGETRIDLWCTSVPAQMVIVENTITIITGPKSAQTCSAERARGDDELLTALAAVTHWQRNGDIVTLRGPKTLRFRASTH
jgi:hypothetical protein